MASRPTSSYFALRIFVRIFCEREHICDFAVADATPIVPLAIAETLFESLLELLEEDTLMNESRMFYEQEKDGAVLIPEALSALDVLKVIITPSIRARFGT